MNHYEYSNGFRNTKGYKNQSQYIKQLGLMTIS